MAEEERECARVRPRSLARARVDGTVFFSSFLSSPHQTLLLLRTAAVVGNLTSSELAHHWQRSVKFRLVRFFFFYCGVKSVIVAGV